MFFLAVNNATNMMEMKIRFYLLAFRICWYLVDECEHKYSTFGESIAIGSMGIVTFLVQNHIAYWICLTR